MTLFLRYIAAILPWYRQRHLLVRVLALLIVVTTTTGAAQARQEIRSTQDVQSLLRGGSYEQARQLFEEQLDASGFQQPAPVVGYAETFLAVGAYEQGLRQVTTYLEDHPENPYLLYAKGRLHEALGQYEEAETAYATSNDRAPDFWLNTLALSELLATIGEQNRARQLQILIYRAYQRGAFRTAETLSVAGRAAAALQQFHEANGAFRRASEANSSHVRTFYWWAELFRQKYNKADAERTYQDALAINPRYAGAYVGLAQNTDSFQKKEELARRALEINPNSVGAFNVLAELRILDGQYEEAKSFVQEARAVNASSVTALAHLASIHHLEGDSSAYRKIEQQAMNVNPHAGDFYLTIVDNIVRRFRYPEAITFARRAVEVEKNNWQAYATLGTSLLRMGQTDMARRYLEISFDRDPFNLFAGNTLTLLDEREQFSVQESEHFRLLIHSSERHVLGPAILAWAEICYDSLTTRYPYRPSGKIQLEAYNDPDDFAVRVAGVPHIGLLGVAFGDVLALNTPRARPNQPFNWTRTLWHEIAHTMAIGLSKHQVPRWLTEGLSVYEERRARERWGREMDLHLFSAFDQDQLLPLEEIDRGFTRPQFPGQIMLTYYHASKIIEFIVDRHGFESVTQILSRLGDGHTVGEAVRQTLDRDLAELDAAFRASLEAERAQMDRVLQNFPAELGGRPAEASWLEKLTGGGENPFLARLQEGYQALDEEDYEAAEAAFGEALQIYPDYIGHRNAYEGLATVYRTQNKTDQLIETLTRFLSVSEYGAAESRELAELYRKQARTEKAIHYLELSLEIDPYDEQTRTQLAELYGQTGQYAKAVEERRAVVSLEPVNEAEALYKLASDLYMNQEIAVAKDTVVRALEVAPGYSDAQQLLLKCISAADSTR